MFSNASKTKITPSMESQMCRGHVNTTNKFRVGYQIRKNGTICKQLISKKFKKTPRLVVKYFQTLDY